MATINNIYCANCS